MPLPILIVVQQTVQKIYHPYKKQVHLPLISKLTMLVVIKYSNKPAISQPLNAQAVNAIPV